MSAVQVRIGRRAALKLALGTIGALLAGCGSNSGSLSSGAAARTTRSKASATAAAESSTTAEATTGSTVANAVSRALASFIVGSWNIAATMSDNGDFSSTPRIVGMMTVTPGQWSYTAGGDNSGADAGTAPRGTWTAGGGTVSGTVHDPDDVLAGNGEYITGFSLGGMPDTVPTGILSGAYRISLTEGNEDPNALQITVDTNRLVFLYSMSNGDQWQTVATRAA